MGRPRSSVKDLVIAVIGVGSVGTLIARYLNVNGIEPFLIHRNRARSLKAVESGILVRDRRGRVNEVRGINITYDDLPTKVDVAFNCVKSYDVEASINMLRENAINIGLLVMCQNGIGSYEYALKVFGEERVACLILNAGAYKDEGGMVNLSGISESYIGQRGGVRNPYIGIVPEILKGLNVKGVSDIEPYRWLKLIVNASVNPITAILRMPNGVILSNEYIKKLAFSVVSEGVKVARAVGVELPKDPFEELVGVVRATSNNFSSMLQDILRKGKTEIDYINGALITIGEDVGVDTPINRALYLLVKSLESNLVNVWSPAMEYR